MKTRLLIAVGILASAAPWASAQSIDDLNLQIHGYATQGFLYTTKNNIFTTGSSDGSAAWTDAVVNISAQPKSTLRVAVQARYYLLGNYGNKIVLDWAAIDYKLNDRFGIRAGKVKTPWGLFNETQDIDPSYIWALLPQSIYPTDLRDATIAHLGGDIYGNVSLKHGLGDLSYTAYAGHRSDSIYSGYPYYFSSFGAHITSFGGLQYGADLRWNTPLKALLIGASRMNEDITGKGSAINPFNPGAALVPYSEASKADWVNQFYGEYTVGRLRIDSEYRRYWRNQELFSGTSQSFGDVRGWYVSGAYRICKRLQIGSYYSRYTVTNVVAGALSAFYPPATDTSLPADHDYDKVITGRVDLNRFWNLKIEGHFMNGYGSGPYPNGFYTQVNTQGFKPNTIALVLKTSLNF